jgi:hypothetical protein
LVGGRERKPGRDGRGRARGVPIVLALQSHADALAAEVWLALLRPGWQLRYALELVDTFEAAGMIPGSAALADAA